MRPEYPGGDVVERYAIDGARRASKISVTQRARQPKGLEELRTLIRREHGDTHLGHDLEDALVYGLDEIARGCVEIKLHLVVAHHVVDYREGQVGIDRTCAIADKEGEMHHLAGRGSLDDKCGLHTLLLIYKVVMHRRGGQQSGYGSILRIYTAV